MPMNRPTLQALVEQQASEIESRLPGVLARARRSVVGVLTRVFAGALSGLYQYVEWLLRQAWPDQADAEFLDDHGARWGVLRKPAAPAVGTVRFTGANDSAVPLGTLVQRVDGVRYATTIAGVIAGGEALVPVQAEVAGVAGNVDAGAALSLAVPVPGVSAVASASTALSQGADVEGDEAYRARVLLRIRQTPMGGSVDDYQAWALAVPGVTRVWTYPGEQGPGSVVVRFMRDDDPTPIPDAGEVTALQTALDLVRPVTAAVTVVAPVASPVNFSIQITPNTAAVKAAVEAELRELIRRDAAPGGTLLISRIREAISVAAGEADHVLTVPAANVVMPTGQIATFGAITWV